ncbi:hypothetical protein SAMN05421780_1103 [Flexibacter flexilis DSM 6793]|uniref:Carboxypeptidase regulatory-like domain-containing protein n=1 Tax=Flexibacter flexilis DSM 6793 TaxID=927664 RepID=A0A1I1M4B1_9BACT|nr:hypothetical protein [Flexibacter flexilis]SFC79582.1 hypothetical protein SAMN05421780_1103 [Flexibacter flexilis DSM 6793]
MKRSSQISLVWVMVGLLLALGSNAQTNKKTTKKTSKSTVLPCPLVKQGVTGKVVFKSGNMMPTIDQKPTGKTESVAREVFIFKVTKMNDLISKTDDNFYEKPKTKLVASVWTKKSGCFAVHLPEGEYSVFVKEKGKYYANSFDGDGKVFPVKVTEGLASDIVFEINYAAVY